MKYIIDKNYADLTIKEFLKKENISHSLLKRLKKIPNGITVNKKQENVLYRLKHNDILELKIMDSECDENEHLLPVELPIEIVYEDENLTVVNKSSNMPTHPSINNYDNTLANALRFRYKDKPYVFRAVNRLDKDTSGLVITANNSYYASIVSKAIKEGKTLKKYIAVVAGRLNGEGVINKPIGRIGKSIIKREIREDGEKAVTRYISLLSCDEASVIELYPETGRTHQLRIHLASIGHPIIGDSLYFEQSNRIDRQALHCVSMIIDGVGKFYAPIPNDILNLIRSYFDNEECIFKN